MKARTSLRILIGALALCTVAAWAWIISLPNQEECRASGRIVDPTERHCTSGAGYEQLQEHATFHAFEVAAIALVVLAAVFILQRIFRRWSRPPAPTG